MTCPLCGENQAPFSLLYHVKEAHAKDFLRVLEDLPGTFYFRCPCGRTYYEAFDLANHLVMQRDIADHILEARLS